MRHARQAQPHFRLKWVFSARSIPRLFLFKLNSILISIQADADALA